MPFFELVQTRHFAQGEIPQSPEHTDMYRLTLDNGDKAGTAKMCIQLSSTLRTKSGISYYQLTAQDLPRLMGALVEMMVNNSGIQPEIPKSRYSNQLNQMDLFTAGRTG